MAAPRYSGRGLQYVNRHLSHLSQSLRLDTSETGVLSLAVHLRLIWNSKPPVSGFLLGMITAVSPPG